MGLLNVIGDGRKCLRCSTSLITWQAGLATGLSSWLSEPLEEEERIFKIAVCCFMASLNRTAPGAWAAWQDLFTAEEF